MKWFISKIEWIRWRDWMYNSKYLLRHLVKDPQYDDRSFKVLKLSSYILSILEIFVSNSLVIIYQSLIVTAIILLISLLMTVPIGTISLISLSSLIVIMKIIHFFTVDLHWTVGVIIATLTLIVAILKR